jgi:hypothetical protein
MKYMIAIAVFLILTLIVVCKVFQCWKDVKKKTETKETGQKST